MSIIPRRSFLNVMDPLHGFPYGKVQDLFDMATPTEAMLVALEHMQVNFCTVARTGLTKFRKNVISFPQDIAGFAQRVGLLQDYRVGSRVNSSRGPGDDPDRRMRRGDTATPEERELFAVDDEGFLVFPATVQEVRGTELVLEYEDGAGNPIGKGVEQKQQVEPRVRMPWEPRFLKGQFAIMLRRNVGRHGDVLEGLEGGGGSWRGSCGSWPAFPAASGAVLGTLVPCTCGTTRGSSTWLRMRRLLPCTLQPRAATVCSPCGRPRISLTPASTCAS